MARRPLDEMIGEAFREVGVLVLVFATLDGIIAGRVTLLWMISSFLLGLLLFLFGCYVERSRLDE